MRIPGRDLLFLIIQELDITVDSIICPEHGNECELVNRLYNLLDSFEEHDIEHIIAILHISHTMARNLAEPLKDMVIMGVICTRKAEVISKLPHNEQPIYAACVIRDGFNMDEVSRLVN